MSRATLKRCRWARELDHEIVWAIKDCRDLSHHLAGAERFKSDAHFARLAGVAPVPVSSGRHDRHRLDHGGNRQINRALHVIAITRGRLDPETRAYLQRKEAEGKTRMEAMSCLERHLARRYYRLLSDRSRHCIEYQVYPGVR